MKYNSALRKALHAVGISSVAAFLSLVIMGCDCGNCECHCLDVTTGECEQAHCGNVDDEDMDGSTVDDCETKCELQSNGVCCRVGGNCGGC